MSGKIVPSEPGVVELTIIKVENLPNMDADEVVDNRMPRKAGRENTTDPFVRMRLKEIDTGEFLDNFEKETSVLLDTTNAYFLEQFQWGHLPHYGLEMHVQVLDKDGDTPDDFIGSVVIPLGERSTDGTWRLHDSIRNGVSQEAQLQGAAVVAIDETAAAQSTFGQLGTIHYKCRFINSTPARRSNGRRSNTAQCLLCALYFIFPCLILCYGLELRRNNYGRVSGATLRRRRNAAARRRRQRRKKRRRRRRKKKK